MTQSVSPEPSESDKSGLDYSVEPSPYNPLDDFTDYEYALYGVVQEGPVYIAQIGAARELLKRQREADRLLEDKIKEADDFARRTTGIINQQAIDDYIDHVHASIYQDAAHSMAALGMLAPLIDRVAFRTMLYWYPPHSRNQHASTK
jgi:hypothetical protein